MVNYSNKIYLNRKRGISTVIGGIIFLVLLTAGFSSFFVAMDVQQDTINAQRTISNSIIEKTQEQFSFAVATDDSNGYKLGIQVKNEGPNPVQISNIWIINKSDVNYPVKNIPINYNDAFITPGTNSSILETQLLYMIPNEYDIKVVSVLGTIKKAELNVGGNNYLLAEMFTIPPDVRQGENATIVLRVTNVGPTKISGVTPDNLLLDDALPPHAQVSYVGPVSIVPVDLDPSESTIFSWDVTLKPAATVGVKVKLSNFATGTESVTGFGVTSNTAYDKIIIRDPQGGSGQTIVLSEDLLSRPEIFAVYPSPFGDSSNDKGIWGLNIVNPTNAIMKISKVTISAFAPGAQNNDKIFQIGGSGCQVENVSPAPAVAHIPGWSCISENQLLWKDLANPQILPPFTTQSFLVKVRPGSAAGSNNLESIIIHGNVFTTFGSFGKTDYATTMVDGTEAVVNVYSTSTATVALLRDNTKINGTISQMASGSTQTFNIVLADMDNDDSEYIQSGAKLIVNVPKNWENVAIDTVNSDGFVMAPLPIVDVHADTSTQIIATSSGIIGDSGRKAAVLVFTADAPSVTNDQMYIMYVLADGTTENNWAIGPLAEIVLHVKKP